MKVRILSVLGILGLATAGYLITNSEKTPKTTHVIRWSMAHAPEEYFTKTAAKFGELVNQRTNGAVTVKVVTVAKDADSITRRLYRRNLLNSVSNGEVDMVQVYTDSLAQRTNGALNVLSAPFLFKDHRHVDRVVEGKIGSDLIKLAQNDKIQSMAFTYSGGFIVLPSHKKEINKIEDFKGINATFTNGIQKKIFRDALGVNLVPKPLDKTASIYKNFEEKTSELTHGTYADIKHMTESLGAKVINDTRHFVLFTSLVINKNFLNSIPKKFHTDIYRSAQDAARYERRLIETDEELTIKNLEKNPDIKVVRMSKPELKRFRAKTKDYYHLLGLEANEFAKRIETEGTDSRVSFGY